MKIAGQTFTPSEVTRLTIAALDKRRDGLHREMKTGGFAR